MTSFEEQRRRTRRLVLCLVVAAVVRLLALDQFSGIDRFHGDEGYYQKTASSILAGNGHPGSLRPPVYAAFIAFVYAIFGKSPQALRFVQIGVSLVAVYLVFRLAAARFGTRAATISGLACALVPSLIHYTHFLWSECLAATLLLLFFWAIHAYDRSGRLTPLALAGGLLGVNALTRETWAFFGVVVVLATFWRHRSQWREAVVPAATFAGCLVLVVIPWTLRNYAVHDTFVLVSTGRWFPLAQGNLMEEGNWLLGTVKLDEQREALRGATMLEQEAHWKTVAIEAIRAEQPWWIFKKAVRNTGLLFSVRSQSIRFIWRGWIELPPWKAYTVIATSVAGHLLMVALGITALWLVPGGWPKQLVVAAILYTIGIHVIANATSRYLVPLMPLFVLYIGPLLAGYGDLRSRNRLIGAGVTLAVLAAVVLLRWNYALEPALDVVQGSSGGS